MRPLGTHIRLISSLDDACARVQRLGCTALQFFLVHEQTTNPLRVLPHEFKKFARFMQDNGIAAFIHASYVINPARDAPLAMHPVFRREVTLAQRLGCSAFVLHPGAIERGRTHADGLAALARFINAAMNAYPSMTFILENTAFGPPVLAGDLHDLRLVLEKVDRPDKLAFCIDTAHAHAYGYDILSDEGRETFVRTIDATLGIRNVVLLHINDSHARIGARTDRHAVLGQGTIGIHALRAFAMHPWLVAIPLIMELPVIDEHAEQAIVQEVAGWHQTSKE